MEIPEDYENLVPEHLNLVKYESSFTVMNLGSLYFVFLFFCIEGFMLFATRPLTIFSTKAAKFILRHTTGLKDTKSAKLLVAEFLSALQVHLS